MFASTSSIYFAGTVHFFTPAKDEVIDLSDEEGMQNTYETSEEEHTFG